MVISQRSIIQACDKLGLKYEFVHKDNISILVHAGKYKLYYTHWFNPYNRSDVRRILKDKDLSYTILSNVMAVPEWKAFIDPDIEKTFPQYAAMAEIHSYDEIVEMTEKDFDYPLIVKPNMKSLGLNVTKVGNSKELVSALNRVHNALDKNYDYLSIIQQRIDIEKEYRVIVFRGEVLLAYEKDISKATFNGNLSPLHWDGGKAVHVTDQKTLTRFQDFVNPVSDVLDLEYGGFDIAVDKAGKMWLIEVNGTPAIGHFVNDCGIDAVVQKDIYILKQLMSD